MAKIAAAEALFTTIYQYNLWGNQESVSGPGSTLKYTENLRRELPKIIKDFSITKIFDAPCGDFNWMRHFLREVKVGYIGGDIVRPLIESLNVKYKNERTKFLHIDLVNGKFPKADLMICRDCLFHLPFRDTRKVLQNFMNANIGFLLTTTHTNTSGFVNKDIEVSGDGILIDLFSSPYNFPANPLARIDDWVSPDPKREMCLWSREQVGGALAAFG